METQTVQPNKDTAIQKVRDYMRSDPIKASFAEAVGQANAGAYISSVLLLVANSPKLQKCTMRSIYNSALRAATLRLSVDPGVAQAYIIPFGDEATFVPGYKGYYQLAIRTGLYRYINIGELYEGEEIIFDRFTGAPTLVGNKKSNKVVGRFAAFEMFGTRDQPRGLSKMVSMTLEQIHAYAKKWSKSYGYSDSVWKTNPSAMEEKTVLRILLMKWGTLDPADRAALQEYEEGPNFLDIVEVDPEAVEKKAEKIQAKQMKKLAVLPTPTDPRPWTAQQVKEYVQGLAAFSWDSFPKVTENERHTLAAALDTSLNGDKTTRYLVTRWLLDVPDGSTKGLTDVQVNALLEWQGIKNFRDVPSDVAIKETIAVSVAALEASGQQKLI